MYRTRMEHDALSSCYSKFTTIVMQKSSVWRLRKNFRAYPTHIRIFQHYIRLPRKQQFASSFYLSLIQCMNEAKSQYFYSTLKKKFRKVSLFSFLKTNKKLKFYLILMMFLIFFYHIWWSVVPTYISLQQQCESHIYPLAIIAGACGIFFYLFCLAWVRW